MNWISAFMLNNSDFLTVLQVIFLQSVNVIRQFNDYAHQMCRFRPFSIVEGEGFKAVAQMIVWRLLHALLHAFSSLTFVCIL